MPVLLRVDWSSFRMVQVLKPLLSESGWLMVPETLVPGFWTLRG